MLVDNINVNVFTDETKKVIGGYDYVSVGNYRDGGKAIYLIKRVGQRSWSAIEIGGIVTKYEEKLIKGDSGNILEKVWGIHSGEVEFAKVHSRDRARLRKVIMEAVCYGTVGKTMFSVNKEG
jgi:hypothetical protein